MVKFSHARYRALGPELIPVYMQSDRRWLEAIHPAVGCHYVPPGLRLPSQPKSVTAHRPETNYTAWWQRHMRVSSLPKAVTSKWTGRDSNPRPLGSRANALPLSHTGRAWSNDLAEKLTVVAVLSPWLSEWPGSGYRAVYWWSLTCLSLTLTCNDLPVFTALRRQCSWISNVSVPELLDCWHPDSRQMKRFASLATNSFQRTIKRDHCPDRFFWATRFLFFLIFSFLSRVLD